MTYLDHAATCPLRPQVWDAMQRLVGEADFNPASIHSPGGKAAAVLENARKEIAAALETSRSDLVFTGGGTQSDNLAILGFARENGGAARIVVSSVEHRAVLEAARRAGVEGSAVDVLPVDGTGRVDPRTLDDCLSEGSGLPTLVSVMWANSEVGTVQPVRTLCEIAHRHGALFHTDAVQAFGKVPVSLEVVPADLLTVTAHKLGGPVGIGLLARRGDVRLEPLSYGGSQERSLWPGTQNPLAAAGFAEAIRLAASELPRSADRWRELRTRLELRLRDAMPDLTVHGDGAPERLPHILSAGIPGCDQAALLTALDMAGFAVSAGSACASGASTGSHVLEAMGVRPAGAYAVLRFSFGPTTAAEDIEAAADAVATSVNRLRGSSA
jgi:cysteine desulfurase